MTPRPAAAGPGRPGLHRHRAEPALGADFTYVATWSGTVYFAFVIDVFSRRIVGWRAATTMTTELVLGCLEHAVWSRSQDGISDLTGLVHHTDAGSQYTSIRLTEHLEVEGIAPSIGSVGDAYDNALMETVNGLYKTDCVRTTIFHTGP